MKTKTLMIGVLLFALALFLAWRFLRPMNIFVVSEAFERPVSTTELPAPLRTLRAEECGTCHEEFYREWSTTMHSRAWTDPYFQVDWRFDRSQQICKNCHTPLDRQQEHTVLGFRDREKWDPILVPNPSFDRKLQHEGVTCAACHFREGKILGPYGSEDGPHPVRRLEDTNQICVRCHVVGGSRWDTFYRFPPCGTVAEIESTSGALAGVFPDSLEIPSDDSERDCSMRRTDAGLPFNTGSSSGEALLPKGGMHCVECHMPVVKRPIVDGGKVRVARRHVWRGGHDPAMVKGALRVTLLLEPGKSADTQRFIVTLTNVGAAHFLPTGTPDRHLTVTLRLLDRTGHVVKERKHLLKRTLLWRPFIIDLWDSRLPRWQPRAFRLEFPVSARPQPVKAEAVVRYHLVDEKRRKRIGYEDKESISYEVFRGQIPVNRSLP